MTLEYLCPICSAGLAGCSHEILRWSSYASEYEEASLLKDALRLEKAVEARLAAAWERRVPPADPDLLLMYEEGLEYFADEGDHETRFSPICPTSYVLDVVAGVPGVITSDEGPETLVLFTENSASVVTAIDDLIRKLELEVAKEEE